MNYVVDFIRQAEVVFWDFDGVIKDSVDIKTQAFESLFLPYGSEVVARVRSHHVTNGGMSRFEKIPRYLKWAGLPASDRQVDEFCNQFSEKVLEGVIDSSWVPGVREYLLDQCEHQYFVLLTATPQNEIELILHRLRIFNCFREVFGSPNRKKETIAFVLQHMVVDVNKVLMIGDAKIDLLAARENNIVFLLRRTGLNRSLQNTCNGLQFESLNG